MPAPVERAVILAGGTGGAKLAAGAQELLGENLTVIANTADDIEILGVHVSPDPDLITYWLCGLIDEERGWGIAGDDFGVAEHLHRLGEPDRFGLTDRDLATCLRRGTLLREGRRQTEAQLEISAALGARARVLPMCDEPVRTIIHTDRGPRPLQQYLIRDRCEPPIVSVEFRGIEASAPSAEVLDALAAADAIIIGPSNPEISIGPILAVPGLAGAVRRAAAPVIAVSPFVEGRVLKGPTVRFMEAARLDPSPAGVATRYGSLADGLLADESIEGSPIPVRQVPMLMGDEGQRAALALEALRFASELGVEP
jgi:LPPG:FO 2-phospho-L-lactate transferase